MSQSDAPRRRFTIKRPVGIAIFWVVLIAALIAGTRFYAPGTEPESTAVVNEDIVADPVVFAQENYESMVVPTITDNAVDLVELTELLSEDAEAAGQAHGHRNGESPYSFPVTLHGVVGEGPFGQVDIAVDGLPEDTRVGVQTGPAVTGTAIRDAVGTITFEMFKNQIDFAAVASALNEEVKEAVLTPTDFDALLGERVTVVGAITYTTPSEFVVTPVSIEVSDG